jgi:hypothetical protein
VGVRLDPAGKHYHSGRVDHSTCFATQRSRRSDNGDAPILNSNVQVRGPFRRNHLTPTDNHIQHGIPRF